MKRYADPQRCPDCASPIVYGATSCPSCRLSLTGPTAGELFHTLAKADELLGLLRTESVAAVPVSVPSSTAPSPSGPTVAAARSRLSTASVPKILLGLGALCLLVAALVFLAVTWSVMGVAGRTATLLGFTAVAGVLAAWLARRGLRAAAESLTVVALGLLAFDLFGARDAGWFGGIVTGDFLVLLGLVLTAAAMVAARAVRRTPVPALSGAEVIATLGLATACVGLGEGDRLAPSAVLTLTVAVASGLALTAHRLRLGVLGVGGATVAAFGWLMLLATSWVRGLAHPSLGKLWLDLEVWPLLVAAASVGAVGLVGRFPSHARVSGVAVAQVVLASAVLLPATDESGTALTLSVLGVLVASTALTWSVPRPWAWGSVVPAVLASAWALGVAVQLTATSVERVADAATRFWGGGAGGALPGTEAVPFAPWLLAVTVPAVVGAATVLARALPEVDRLVAPLADPVLGFAVLLATAVGTVAAYPVPVWVVLALLLLGATAGAAWALARRDALALALGAVFLCGAQVVGWYDEWLTSAALLVALVLCAAVLRRWAGPGVVAVAGFLAASAVAGSVWTWCAILDVAGTWATLASLATLAALVLALGVRSTARSTGVEVGAAVAGAVVSLAGIASSPVSEVASWTAVYLTVAGAVATTVALLRADRRRLGWLGGLLLAAASWVRLWDVGVSAPEAYTLPSAVALTLVGLVHLRRNPDASTMSALAPGITLGLVPSLVWALAEPATSRSLLLGTGCLLLLLAGLRLRWTAPVVLAATVGAAVVLRHAAPYLGDAVPRWVLFAAAGAVLISTGITWERRLAEARAFAGYVRALR